MIMPHNLYLHSALVKSRDIDRRRTGAVRQANKYFFIESSIALFVSFLINVFVVAVFASGLYGKQNDEILKECLAKNNSHAEVFPNNTDLVDADLYKGGIFLGCVFGLPAMYIWSVGILAAGQSSTMTGTYAGQFAMEGFLNLKWKRWQRVLLTRTVAVLPTFFVAFYEKIDDLTGMNDLLNCLMSLQLPFALIPTIAFTSNPAIMGEFANGLASKIFSLALSALVIFVNIYFVFQYVIGLGITAWYFILFVITVGVGYLAFCLYLTIDMAINMGAHWIAQLPVIGSLYMPCDETFFQQQTPILIDDDMDESSA